ncbi:dihydrodipicolinate synthase family protein [Streptomyces albireticuli]|uniref:Dihydrodipicolinate synthase family protein n=1 Tax=Streptomyces albireticuli TaxID=1940 RepID=A0A2A2D163_9ACTN|nr:dihydrodipicolinate synthase family protein [Streptomyces albireticuli]MCD9141353.1 dihydrodipicolinate synthase family protein [Streptomyces albireticuli]MCD9160686.1 dihydrodipicolinate synthase family protein [Streptomyces albireticuli]MCD9195758.1 dihydrodipicolinate synthase family protein [Streptomyces albireticuli]PAU45254.1 dihydrodipicolinate synthase family protein [Streptomyces albireticuli]
MPSSERAAAEQRLKALRGTVVPLVTPVDEDRRVSAPDVARLVASLRGQVAGYMPALSTGEGWHLSTAQWTDVVRLTVEHAGGAPVLAGVELPGVDEIVARAELAAGLGADAVVVPPPWSGDGGAAPLGFVEHYATVVGRSPLPVVVYHENVVSKAPLDLDALLEVCALPGVVGVKESSGSAEFTRKLLEAGPAVPVLQGWEHLLSAVPGVQGFVGPLANLDPAVCDEALSSPGQDVQKRVDALSERYGLLADDWYLHVKEELVRRGTIGTPLAVN